MIMVELREGAYYVWNRDQLLAALGEEDAAWAAEVFSVTPTGTFEHGASTLQLRSDHDQAPAGRRSAAAPESRVISALAPGATTRSLPPGTDGWSMRSVQAAMIFAVRMAAGGD